MSQAAVAASYSAGVETLRRMAGVDRYNRWIFQKLARHVGRRVLEVGCGIGNMTPFWLGAERVVCVDLEPELVAFVRGAFAEHPQVEARVEDIAAPGAAERLGAGAYDTVVCLNVLEHIEDDHTALRAMHDALAPGGKLLLFVPAGMYLFGRLDEALGHFRRYSLAEVETKVRVAGLAVDEAFYMNVAGVPGWFLSSRVLRRQHPPRGMLKLFNLLTPLFIWFEERFKPGFGQSVVCVARRPG